MTAPAQDWTIAKARDWLLNLTWPTLAIVAINTPKVRATARLLSELGAAHDVKDAEIARLKQSQLDMYGGGKQLEGELRQRAQDAEAQLSEARAQINEYQAELHLHCGCEFDGVALWVPVIECMVHRWPRLKLEQERDALTALVDEAVSREGDGSLWSYGELSDYFKAWTRRAAALRSKPAEPSA